MQQQEFTDCFVGYQSIAEMLRTCEYEEILGFVSGLAGSTPERVEQYPVEYSAGTVIGTHRSVVQDLQKNIAQYDWLYARLEDDLSRTVLINLISYRIFPGRLFLEAARDATIQDPMQESSQGDCGSPGPGGAYSALEGSGGHYEEIMDKGGVRAALIKRKKHIRDDVPKLAICLHYSVSDMWEIPKLIDTVQSGYRLFLRFRLSDAKAEIVLYALPQEQKRMKSGKTVRRIVSISAKAAWNDAQLVKDCGAISYLLYKNHACDVSMVGARQQENYSNLRYVQGLKLEFLPDETLQGRVDYLLKESAKIDGLLFYGAYTEYLPLADVYKNLNPEGKIYLALDANSFWMDRIQWAEPKFRRLLNQCDVIGTAGHVMQRHLNEKWPWIIDYFPNGFYNFAGTDMTFSYEKKENIILTVGRLGTPEKATYVLLEAFASIAARIPDWSLYLAGTVDPQWEKEYLTGFWERYPELKERICFLGQISGRDALYREYLRAKIFALPSKKEGSPNVIAEALYAGNAMAITKIDEYQDAIDNGSCGLAAESGDVKSFADILLQLCQSEELEKMCRRSHEYAKEVFDMERIVDRLYYMLFGEE